MGPRHQRSAYRLGWTKGRVMQAGEQALTRLIITTGRAGGMFVSIRMGGADRTGCRSVTPIRIEDAAAGAGCDGFRCVRCCGRATMDVEEPRRCCGPRTWNTS